VRYARTPREARAVTLPASEREMTDHLRALGYVQ
jgi:hypothetical protein